MIEEKLSSNMKVAIVVPVYKEMLDDDEMKSVASLRQFCAKYPIFSMCPRGLQPPLPYETIEFDKRHFKSIDSYNELMLSADFYSRFDKYDYILIFQLDAVVFSDRLLEFCNLGYDYIGAPWLRVNNDEVQVLGVGNGGLSLRRVEACIDTLRSKKRFRTVRDYYSIYSERSLLMKIAHLPNLMSKIFRLRNNLKWFLRKFNGAEDQFWGLYASGFNPNFKVAPVDVAVDFAFELEPRAAMKINKGKKPFGCHAWSKYDRQFIESLL